MKKEYPLVTILVPVFRSEYFIESYINSISKIRYPNFEVVMIFDPSPDRSMQIARRMLRGRKNWHIIINCKHLGVSKSLNLGIKKSKGKYIAFIMMDMLVDPLCLKEQINFFQRSKDKNLGVVVAKTYDFHRRNILQAYRMYLLPQTGYLYIPEYGSKDNKYSNKPFEGFSGIDGTLFKKEVFEKMGNFDNEIDTGINDLDMIWKVWLSGYKVIRIPTAKVYHWSLKEGRATVKWEFAYARMASIFIQNYSFKYLLKYLPQLFAVYSFRSLITLMQGNPNPIKGLVKSIVWSLKNLPITLQKRKIIQNQIRTVSDDYLYDKIFGKLSLWDFYKHILWVQKKITPEMLNKQSGDERILTYSK